ncbi:MAG: ABC transporter substrate-binding protein [Mycobacterium sp.]
MTVAVVTTTVLALAGCSGGASSPTDSTSDGAGASIGSGPLYSELPASIQQANRVVVLSDIPSPPYEMFVSQDSREVTGLDYDLAQALGRQLGVEFTFKQTPFSGIIPALQAHQGDVIISQMSATTERQKVLDFVQYFQDGTGIMVLKGNAEGIQGVADLCGKSVATQSGAQQVAFVQAQSAECTKSGKAEITVLTLPTFPDTQLALRSGKVVAIVQDTGALSYAARTIGDGNVFEVVTPSGSPAGYNAQPGGIGVLKDNVQLTNAIQKALQTLITDGSYRQILDKYGLASIAVDKSVIGSGS